MFCFMLLILAFTMNVKGMLDVTEVCLAFNIGAIICIKLG